MKQQGKIRQIFLDHFERFLEVAKKSQETPPTVEEPLLPNGKKKPRKKKQPKKIIRVRPVQLENIYKMLACRTGILGYHWYICPLGCGFEIAVPHSCKSRFCSCCGYIATDNWIKVRFNYLLDCPYQHVVVTIPAAYRWMIKLDKKVTLNFFLHCATETIQEWSKDRGFTVGIISFYHSFGGIYQFHPHFHLIVSCGGIRKDGSWQDLGGQLPPHVIVEKFKAKFVNGFKELFKTEKLKTTANLARVLYQIDHPFDNHWQFHVERITRSNKATMAYCIRYAKKMIISEKRIYRYDGKQIFYVCSKKVNGKKIKFIQQDDAITFIDKVIQHIPEKHFKLIRYFGFYANNIYTKKLYDHVARKFKPLDDTGEKDSWRNRQWRRNRKDPLTCPRCKCELVLSQVTFPSYYLMYNWGELLAANHQRYQQRLITCLDYSERKKKNSN